MRKRFKIRSDKENPGEYQIMFKQKGWLGLCKPWRLMINTNDYLDAAEVVSQYVLAEKRKDSKNMKKILGFFMLNSAGAGILTYLIISLFVRKFFGSDMFAVFSFGWTISMRTTRPGYA